MSGSLDDLSAAGVSVWLDDLSRERLLTGNFADLIAGKHIVGVTTNPSIFREALSAGHAYDEQIRDLALRGCAVGEAVRALQAYDVRWGCDLLRPVYEGTGGLDGRVSYEVDPRMTPPGPSPRPRPCGGWWTGPTSTSRSRLPGKARRPSPRPSPKGSA